MKEIPKFDFKYLIQHPERPEPPEDFSESAARNIEAFHSRLPGYRPTNLVRLGRLARIWGIGDIFIKDESTRFGLKAFKVLGSSYAAARLLSERLGRKAVDFNYLASAEARRLLGDATLATATDGNHGRGVAWTAQQLGLKAVIYMPARSAPARVRNIRSHGAIVEVTGLSYDDTVRLCRRTALERGWYVIQDTAWEGYEDVPRWVMQGYLTMCREAVNQMKKQGARPTHVVVQSGVGSLPAAVAAYMADRFRDRPPRIIVIEPNSAACFFESACAKDGRPHAAKGNLETIMAGLACGEPNPIAWNILRDFADCFMSCGDFVAANGMRILANPLYPDAQVESGESGGVGMGLLDLLMNNPEFETVRQELEIGPDASVLLLNTEGVTDPVNYLEVVWRGKCPSPF